MIKEEIPLTELIRCSELKELAPGKYPKDLDLTKFMVPVLWRKRFYGLGYVGISIEVTYNDGNWIIKIIYKERNVVGTVNYDKCGKWREELFSDLKKLVNKPARYGIK
ncbi:MAG: hypothetical protein UU80_C0024G0008 [candidate division WWE3 bacterium GW2011_GWA1_41_8]|jgi:hypothetical protein|uniref:Uncharacterized protein n=3 Tax=Katanobacteria TaxID=422282 RepID=A0A0G0XBA9_UNCKA|nr:MAG: hypothetical protein UU72_C0023G0008 [candidate division WWE3 bacterium GW2011_GWB1_41_6]KKS21647.1 MAG: hypothetical protein UU80_C0024G0008 [candidate division WWE3 bacterium GW2011_GWA1_41_8]OGC58137.1 MAG: hypothetical protein A2976_04780 [candidate division WWE3 bacterium RIFCSPLOWO2_01_FULL_41_9]